MKEKRKDKHEKIRKREKKHKRHKSTSSSSSDSETEKLVKRDVQKHVSERDAWMNMTGIMKTYSKDDVKPKENKSKQHIDSYNPGTSSRELNPYWKHGGTGLPQSSKHFQKSRPFLKPSDDVDDYYSKSSSSKHDAMNVIDKQNKYGSETTHNWKKVSERSLDLTKESIVKATKESDANIVSLEKAINDKKECKHTNSLYLSDEKMNKLAAKIVKAEIMGNVQLVNDLKAKLEAAREYRKQNPDAVDESEDNSIMLIATNNIGNTKPLEKRSQGNAKGKSGKRKAETYTSGQRTKYFGNDDQYNLSEMFQQEKYGSNYEEDAQLARIAGKHKNPNDDLEDIFLDEISTNKNSAKDSEKERNRAISQHTKLTKSLEGCDYCIDSKNMLKHLMVSCGTKVYLSLPARRSMVKGQCILTTVQHSTCVTSLDEDVWEEILNYRKALTQFFNSQNKDVIFYETATRLHKFPHMVINCVPLPRDVGDMAAIYFKKALLECEAEWSMNKKVVDLKGKDVRKGVPRGLPYFWIDFGMDPGFAHVIEDQQLFPRTFAEEIISGILDLDHHSWKNPPKEYGDLQRKKVLEFVNEWKPFDLSNNKL